MLEFLWRWACFSFFHGKRRSGPTRIRRCFGRYFLKPALWLYKRCQKKETGRKLREELRLLYPAGGEERFRRYQVEKLSGLLLVCFAAAVLGGLIRISGGMEQRLTEDGWLRRNSYGEGEADVRLKGQAAGTEGWEQEVELTVFRAQIYKAGAGGNG